MAQSSFPSFWRPSGETESQVLRVRRDQETMNLICHSLWEAPMVSKGHRGGLQLKRISTSQTGLLIEVSDCLHP